MMRAFVVRQIQPPFLRFVAGGDARTLRDPDDKGSAQTSAAILPRRGFSPSLRPLPGSEDREEVQAVRQGARVQAAAVRRARGPGQGLRLQGKNTQLCDVDNFKKSFQSKSF